LRDRVELPYSGENWLKVLGKVSDSSLMELYATADLFVMPSLYEGFGLPVLEAMAVGCPTAISNIPVFREIWPPANGLCDYFEPLEPSSIRSVCEAVLARSPLDSRRLAINAHAYAIDLSWDRTASRTWSVVLT
jgi:glycosyltransferase involved in cell wall biosynthesis